MINVAFCLLELTNNFFLMPIDPFNIIKMILLFGALTSSLAKIIFFLKMLSFELHTVLTNKPLYITIVNIALISPPPDSFVCVPIHQENKLVRFKCSTGKVIIDKDF